MAQPSRGAASSEKDPLAGLAHSEAHYFNRYVVTMTFAIKPNFEQLQSPWFVCTTFAITFVLTVAKAFMRRCW
jgi:hypothetical protein